jgi:FHS family glucose/mannose:H+ symporter-like MFS transporter
LPMLLVVAFLVVSQVSTAIGGVLAFGLAGLACSAFLPLSISFGGKEFPRLTAVVSGELIAFYQVGYGIAAFGTGLLLNTTGIPLSTIYVGACLVAGAMIVLAFLVIKHRDTKSAPSIV